MKHQRLYFIALLFLIKVVLIRGYDQYESSSLRGQYCVTTFGDSGICTYLNECQSPYLFYTPKHYCGIEGDSALICCVEKTYLPFQLRAQPEQTTAKTTTTEANFVPINTRISPKSIADQKCNEYFEIAHKISPVASVVTDGDLALAKEFPHMATLGYGSENDIKFLCGGSLISEDFVLTAAHCLHSSEMGPVKFVRLGDLDIKSNEDLAQPQQFKVEKVFEHPDYSTPLLYNDIALIKLNGTVNFTAFTTPACLYASAEMPIGDVIATGWGSTLFAGEPSSHLLKVDLRLYDQQNCSIFYMKEKRLENNIDGSKQICAGKAEKGKDSCSGDSGGPLQIVRDKFEQPNIYKIFGITSFGKSCGQIPGVYTKVSHYVSWIQNIVWGI